MLAHHPDIDTVAIGESEATFLELVDRLAAGRPTAGLAGTAYRVGDRIELGPKRAAIEDLDALASPHDWFDTHIVMTSRGCPWACTFCGAETSWGRSYRGQSVTYVLDALERAVSRAPVKMIQIKDDTFTTNKKRVLELCRGIRERKLRFLWSCDTRVDVLGEELLYEMRLAGCERLSLGVESGSQKHPRRHRQEDHRGRDPRVQRPRQEVRHQAPLLHDGRQPRRDAGHLRRDAGLSRARAAAPVHLRRALGVPRHAGLRSGLPGGLARRRALLRARLPGAEDHLRRLRRGHRFLPRLVPAQQGPPRAVARGRGGVPRHPRAPRAITRPRTWTSAAPSIARETLDEAEQHVRRALELGYPLPGLALNYLACIAARRGDYEGDESSASPRR